jgi:hypothetical protein
LQEPTDTVSNPENEHGSKCNAGMPPIHETLLGMVDAASDAKRQG